MLEGETRASDNSWANGDVFYVSYSNGGNTKVSSATYISSLGAFQFSLTSLIIIGDASCSVYYFRGGSFSISDNTVMMDKHTAIVTDTSAKYTCSSNVITMSSAFKPYTWRLCFKGITDTEVRLGNELEIGMPVAVDGHVVCQLLTIRFFHTEFVAAIGLHQVAVHLFAYHQVGDAESDTANAATCNSWCRC